MFEGQTGADWEEQYGLIAYAKEKYKCDTSSWDY
jgi:hypothetical protein